MYDPIIQIAKAYDDKLKYLFDNLEKEDNLSESDAVSRANEISKEISNLVSREKRNEMKVKLHKASASAYLLASDKAPKESRIKILAQASFWNDLAESEQ